VALPSGHEKRKACRRLYEGADEICHDQSSRRAAGGYATAATARSTYSATATTVATGSVACLAQSLRSSL